MNRRDFLATVAGAIAVPTLLEAVPTPAQDVRPRDTNPLHPHSLFHQVQRYAINSEAPLILLTGARAVGKSWVLQRIAEKWQRRYLSVGLIPSGPVGRHDWKDLDLDPDGQAIRMLCADWLYYEQGMPVADVIIIDNADRLSDRDFESVICKAHSMRRGIGHNRQMVIAMPPYRNRSALATAVDDGLLEADLFEVHHLGSMFDNPYLGTKA